MTEPFTPGNPRDEIRQKLRFLFGVSSAGNPRLTTRVEASVNDILDLFDQYVHEAAKKLNQDQMPDDVMLTLMEIFEKHQFVPMVATGMPTSAHAIHQQLISHQIVSPLNARYLHRFIQLAMNEQTRLRSLREKRQHQRQVEQLTEVIKGNGRITGAESLAKALLADTRIHISISDEVEVPE